MSAAAPTLRVAPRWERHRPATTRAVAREQREWVRLATFAALSLYAVGRWAILLRPAPTARLLGLVVVAVALAGGVPWLRRRDPVLPVVLAVVLVMAALPVAGLPWQWFIHLRVAVSARDIGNGLSAFPSLIVPYSGAGHAVRLVITLGAAVLLLDSAMVMAFSPPVFGDARRAAVALPLVALAIVPSTLVRPQLPYMQGLMLFGLLAAFGWGDRLRRDAVGTALGLSALVGIAAAIVAPSLDQHKPWVDYRAWAGTPAVAHVASFDWNQTYGPLRWPRTGHAVLTVRAPHADYWKAEDLDLFNGYAWVRSAAPASLAPPAPDRLEQARWTQRIDVSIEGMKTEDVIAAGVAGRPTIAGGASESVDPGTWLAADELRPGSTYSVQTYSPHPTAGQLRVDAGGRYPVAALTPDLTLSLPYAHLQQGALAQVRFAAFDSNVRPSVQFPSGVADASALIGASPYAGAYVLARALAARAGTPYAFVASVQRYLSRGYRYDENPPARRYPLQSFLFTNKLGYCQQFSGAMALLLRMGGVPARVAAGFTTGAYDYTRHQWVVSDVDAHAWVEVWFPRYGWVRFDPTPATAPARVGTGLLPLEKRQPGSAAHAALAPRPGVGPSPGAITVARRAGHRGAGSAPEIVAGALAALIVLGLSGLLLRGPMDDEQLLAELERALARSGSPLRGGVTLASLEGRFRASPGAEEYVRSLRLARYGGASARPTAAQRRALRRQLHFGLGLSGRLRALWALPPRPRLSSRRPKGGLRS